jgi:formylglycine-generating enzyme required for sulfatase activity
VRRALRREVERDHPLFLPELILDARDLRRLAQWQWRDPVELPERGPLIPGLSRLAYGMQLEGDAGAGAQRRIGLSGAEALVDHPLAGDILRAGLALDVLDEDPAQEDLSFRHQLFQEYFAARTLARAPRAELAAQPWREADIQPAVAEVLAAWPPGESLPPLPQTGWEETSLLAAVMTEEPAAFLASLAGANLALAGRAASLPQLRERLPAELLDQLRASLLGRSRDMAADLRARIAAALALGTLGDPRFPRDRGPEGAFLRPPLARIAAGVYPMGDDDPVVWMERETRGHLPRHLLRLAAFRIGCFPVTNAEWACFMTAGGYEDARWWDTAAGRAWREGRGTAAGIHADIREWLARFRSRPEFLGELVSSGQLDDEAGERWRRRLAMTEAELGRHLLETYPERRLAEPRFWRDERFNAPSQPVVGICWYEARAYCAWLSAASGEAFDLPTEAQWEAAARGEQARRYAGGDHFQVQMGNTAETRLRQTSPVGVFPAGDTPEGVSDLTGNVFEWTSSLLGEDSVRPRFAYPYRADDGREDRDAAPEVLRVGRGGSWYYSHPYARAASRDFALPAIWNYNSGFRLAAAWG